MEISCSKCNFCEVVVEEGVTFTILNPHGDEVNRAHPNTVRICRANPPLGGVWPEVSEDDWCGAFSEKIS